MKLDQLKEWVNSLPEEVLNCEVVYRNFVVIENDSENLFAKDINIAACGIDEETQEAYFCDQDSAVLLEGNLESEKTDTV